MASPTWTMSLLSLTLIATSGRTTIVASVSVAELLAVLVSVTPAAVAMLAVLVREPVADEASLQVAVKLACPPFGRFTVSLMLPLPDAAHEPPDVRTQVQVHDDSVD